MSRFMYLQCQSSHIPMPYWSKRWVNLRKCFCNFYRVRRAKLITMLEILGLAFEGHQHSGLDDTRNIARIVMCMLEDGADLHPNEELFQDKRRRNHAQICPVKREDITGDKSEDTQKDHVVTKDHLDEEQQNETHDWRQGDAREKKHCDKTEGHYRDKNPVDYDEVDNLTATVNDMSVNNQNFDAEIDDLLCYYALQKS